MSSAGRLLCLALVGACVALEVGPGIDLKVDARGALGLQVQPATAVVITVAPDGPAHRAGVPVHSLLSAINGVTRSPADALVVLKGILKRGR